MTVADKLSALLVKHGLWDHEAEAIIQTMREDDANANLAEVFNKEWDGYPPQFHAVAWMITKRQAIEWIDANKPQHFARSALTA